MVFRFLVEEKGSPDRSALNKINSLHLSCLYGVEEIVVYLVSERSVSTLSKDTDGNNCLHFACEGGTTSFTI